MVTLQCMPNHHNQKTIKASEFKAKCLALIDQVAEDNQELIITKNLKPVAKLAPFKNKPRTLFRN